MLGILRPRIKGTHISKGVMKGSSIHSVYTYKEDGKIAYFYRYKKDGITIPWFMSRSDHPITRHVGNKNITVSLTEGSHFHQTANGPVLKRIKRIPV